MKSEDRSVVVGKPQAGPGRAWLELIYARSMQLTRPLFGVESHSTERGPPRLSHTMRKFGLSGVTPPPKARKTMETAQRRRRKRPQNAYLLGSELKFSEVLDSTSSWRPAVLQDPRDVSV